MVLRETGKLPDRKDAMNLLRQRAEEYGLLHFLLAVLNTDIDLRRKLEQMQRIPFRQKRSVTVEMQRELIQERIKTVSAEMDSLVNLIARTIENE
jgi:hypothetical protein